MESLWEIPYLNLDGGFRRILPVPARSGGGRLIERTPAVQHRRRERVKMPHRRHLPPPIRSARSSSNRSHVSHETPAQNVRKSQQYDYWHGPGPSMSLCNATKAALRLIGWCRRCGVIRSSRT